MRGLDQGCSTTDGPPAQWIMGPRTAAAARLTRPRCSMEPSSQSPLPRLCSGAQPIPAAAASLSAAQHASAPLLCRASQPARSTLRTSSWTRICPPLSSPACLSVLRCRAVQAASSTPAGHRAASAAQQHQSGGLLQGRAACEIDTADELLATELLLNGEFSSLDEHLLAALASTLIPQEQTNVRLPCHAFMADVHDWQPSCLCVTSALIPLEQTNVRLPEKQQH